MPELIKNDMGHNWWTIDLLLAGCLAGDGGVQAGRGQTEQEIRLSRKRPTFALEAIP
jgi:hypothetical protein